MPRIGRCGRPPPHLFRSSRLGRPSSIGAVLKSNTITLGRNRSDRMPLVSAPDKQLFKHIPSSDATNGADPKASLPSRNRFLWSRTQSTTLLLCRKRKGREGGGRNVVSVCFRGRGREREMERDVTVARGSERGETTRRLKKKRSLFCLILGRVT